MEMPNYSNLVYQRPSLERFRECALKTRLKLMSSKSIAIIEESLADFQKQLSLFYTADALCQICHDQNTADQFYLDEMDYFVESEPVVSELSTAVYSMLLSSTIAPKLKHKFGEMIFRKAQTRKDTVSSEIVDELSQESALENDYDQILSEAQISFKRRKYNLSMMVPFMESTDRETRRLAQKAVSKYFSDQLGRFDNIFDEMVRIRSLIANKLSYPSFVELGYRRMERYDYTPEMVSEFRDLVVRYIVPITIEIRRLQKKRLGLDELKYYDLPCLFASGNPKPIVSKDKYHKRASEMFRTVFEKNPCFYDVLQTHGFTDIISRKAKATGGYCATLLDYGIPFIFMNANGTADDVATLIHESGHAYAAIRSVNSSPFIECLSPTLETCEIHSTSLEYLTYPYLEKFFGDRAGAYRDLHLTQALLFLPYGCLVDEFQHKIYEDPTLSPAERHIVWKELENKYQPFLDYDGDTFYEKGAAWVKKSHIFTDPFYYIDYCLSQIVSLQLWDLSRSHPQQAMIVYDQICLEGGNSTFLDLLKKSGLESPFSAGVVKRVAYMASEYLNL